MSALPWIVGASAVGFGAYLWREQREREGALSGALPPRRDDDVTVAGVPLPNKLPGRWVWPVAAWNGRAPVVSSGYGMRGNGMHNGVDVMFRREASDALLVAGTPNASKQFVMPDNLPALAAHDGVVWSAMKTLRGFAVVIDHAPLPIATFYTHLDPMFVKPTARGAGKERVRAGQPIGNIGYDPTDRARLKHLHFEVWLGGPTSPRSAIDPEPLMATWEVIGRETRAPLMAEQGQREPTSPAHGRA